MKGAGWHRHLILAAMTMALVILARALGQFSEMSAPAHAAIRFGGAIILGLLLTRARGRGDIVVICAAALLAAFAWRVGGIPARMAAASGLSSVTAGLGAFLLIRRFGSTVALLDRMHGVLLFIAASAGASLVAAAMRVAVAGTPDGALIHGVATHYPGILLGLLLVTPIVLVCTGGTRTTTRNTVLQLPLALAVTAAVTIPVFMIQRPPLLFVIIPAVLFATFRLRHLGAAASTLLVAAIAAFATSAGYGPIASAMEDHAQRMLVLQIFLGTCFVSVLPIAAILSERDRVTAAAQEIGERFRAVVENIGEVIFQIDVAGRWAYLNPAWEPLSGSAVAASLGLPWIDCVAEADRAELLERVAPVLAGTRKSTRRAVRLNTERGVRWAELFVQGMRGMDGAMIGATGTLRDIDDRKQLEEHVMSARRHAEQRAREATLLASTDELTGLASRRAFMRQLDREIAGAAEFDWPLAVAIFDVDHFKAVNDRHGHAVGDRVLQKISRRAEGVLRGGDMVGRLGGEEFAIIMPGATAADAAAVAERLRAAVEQRGVQDIALPAVTVSIGIAEREGQRAASALLSAADAALYEAKNSGRNRVRIAA